MRLFIMFLIRGFVLSIICGASIASAAEVTIYDRATQQALPQYRHHGRTYVAGEPGHEYEIRIRSNSSQRVLAVTTVDGINVITGETAALEQSGYVLDAYAEEGIQGWRKSMSHTAAFYFTSVDNSYAALTGRGNQVGVIGVAIFRERDREAERQAYSRLQESRAQGSLAESAAPSAPATSAREKSSADRSDKFDLGTGHGASEYSAARYTNFERASSRPDQTITIYYDSRRNLLAQNIIPRDTFKYPHRYADRLPNAFPRSMPGFTPDP